MTGALLAQQVKVGSGRNAKLQQIAGRSQITLATVKPLLDELAAAALPNLEGRPAQVRDGSTTT